MMRLTMFLWLAVSVHVQGQENSPISFGRDIQPVLRVRCMQCHGFEDRQGELDMRSVELLLRGGKQGASIVPGDASASLIYRRIMDGSMPPEGELRLPEEKTQLIKDWLDQGAKAAGVPEISDEIIAAADRDHWSFRPLHRPAIPPVKDDTLAQTPIDRFLLEKLDEAGLSYSPVADRRTWIRRLSFDLTGLPPTQDELDQFLQDEDDKASQRAIDRFLEKPQFGERWGRHWLDAAGYVDTGEADTDAAAARFAKGKWRYRDWVIRSLNQNKPFDQFVREQVAGDEMVDWREADEFNQETIDLLVATTFLRSAADETDTDVSNTSDVRTTIAQQTMEVTLNSLLALTMKCARCHDHKYDPVPQTDYYRLLAFFTPALNPQAWLQPKKRELPDIPPNKHAEFEKQNAPIEKKVNELEEQKKEINEAAHTRVIEDRYNAIPEPIREDARTAITTAKEKRTEVQAYLAEKFAASVTVTLAEAKPLFEEQDLVATEKLDKEIGQLKSQVKGWGIIQAVYNVSDSPRTYVLVRGNHERPALEVQSRVLQILSPSESPDLSDDESNPRTALARWLTDPESLAAALMARVVVSRAWRQLFGRGLVETNDNFGLSGASPSHPELLEWVVADFIESGWDYKRLIRLMVNSRVYRQRSDWDGQIHDADPANTLLARMPLRQLESEAVRDAVLHVGGDLNLKMSGPPVMVYALPDGNVVTSGSPEEMSRRSIYLLQRRRYHESFLDAFGQPDLNTNCTDRISAATVGQSLSLLNSEFLFDQSHSFAHRVIADSAGNDVQEDIAVAYELALGRTPSNKEIVLSKELIETQRQRYVDAGVSEENLYPDALRHLCHMLLCSNEFLYVH